MTADRLAINGGEPVRRTMLPYGRQNITEDDIAAVCEVLRSDFLTTGPRVPAFEAALAAYVGAREAVVVSSGTAALHAMIHAFGIGPGDEVIVPPMTFAATANAVVYEGATPVFADVDPDTLLLDPAAAEAAITERTKAILAVDYAGQPCDYTALRTVADRHGLALLADGCHALGASDESGRRVGNIADATCFSFHPVKPITTAEGGAVTTNDPDRAARMRVFRNHGITSDFRDREAKGAFHYEMVELGFNYRLSDLQCALGIEQLKRIDAFTAGRRVVAQNYAQELATTAGVESLTVRQGCTHAFHLYPVRLDDALSARRGQVFAALRAEGIGVNVHYVPVHLHPYYVQRFGTSRGMCPVAEGAYDRLLTLPVFPAMTKDCVLDVRRALDKVTSALRD